MPLHEETRRRVNSLLDDLRSRRENALRRISSVEPPHHSQVPHEQLRDILNRVREDLRDVQYNPLSETEEHASTVAAAPSIAFLKNPRLTTVG